MFTSIVINSVVVILNNYLVLLNYFIALTLADNTVSR